MVKLALLISLMILTGCKEGSMFSSKKGPKFAVGDCVALASIVNDSKAPLESWETDKDRGYSVERILEIGKLKYRTLEEMHFSRYMIESSLEISFDDILVKVECPKRLGGQ